MAIPDLAALRATLGGVDCFASQAEWDDHWRAHAHVLDDRSEQEQRILRDASVDGVDGVCALCATAQRFALPSRAAGKSPSLREELLCNSCRLNARMRAGFGLLTLLCPQRDARIYLTEQASFGFVWLHGRYRRSFGSEFTHSVKQRARLMRWLWSLRTYVLPRFEDVTRLRQRAASLDAVVSFDVLEHVPDHRAAIAEFARVTRPGGWLVLSVPIDLDSATSIVRARIREDGAIEHLLDPEYHGDPLGAGVLCYHGFGWDLLADLRDAGYRHCVVALPWNPRAALLSGLSIVIAQR